MHVFQFVQLVWWEGLPVIRDCNAAHHLERRRIKKPQGRGAVRKDDALSVLRQTPPLACIRKSSQKFEAETVVDQRDMALPGQLDQRASPVGQPLAEVLGHILELQDAPRLNVFHPQRRVPLKPGAFVQMAVQIDQPLREGLRVVRVGVHHLHRVIPPCSRSRRERDKESKKHAVQSSELHGCGRPKPRRGSAQSCAQAAPP